MCVCGREREREPVNENPEFSLLIGQSQDNPGHLHTKSPKQILEAFEPWSMVRLFPALP